jgi:hypothetical protein
VRSSTVVPKNMAPSTMGEVVVVRLAMTPPCFLERAPGQGLTMSS